MIKIGFIDYYLDEWHANNYPAWIRDSYNGEMEVAFAYGLIDSPKEGGMTSAGWCEKYQIEHCEKIEELIEKSDVLVVLSPDNCEMHEQLCQLPLRSGKRTFVDKTFAPDKASAERIFDIAQKHNTPCYSCSALRSACEYREIDTNSITAINCWGPGNYEVYSVHQLEPLIMLMKTKAKRVMALSGEKYLTMIVEFCDGRIGTISQFAEGSPFMMNVCSSNGNKVVKIESDFFHEFILELGNFFKNGTVNVPNQETISIMEVREAGAKALKCPGQWVEIN
jgi:hypothetical protein